MLAEAIRESTNNTDKNYIHKNILLSHLTGKLKEDNHLFDDLRFINACNIAVTTGTKTITID